MINNNFKNGFEIVKAEDFSKLNSLRKNIYLETKKIFNIPEKDPSIGFNNFHKYVKNLSATEINTKKVKLIKKISNKFDFGEIVFNSFEKIITKTLGPDILVQKTCNFVIQVPRDPNPSSIHRDAPFNSAYEVVVWIPLVDCYKTKSMYILDKRSTDKSLKFLNKNKNNWKKFENYAKKLSINPSISFGQGLFFFSGLIHGSEINREKETRISLNVRFKNLFAPSGIKNQYQFFKPLRISNIAKMGAEVEAGEIFD